MKNVVFWDIMPRGFCKNRHFGGTYRLHLHDGKISELGTVVQQLFLARPDDGSDTSSEMSVLQEQHRFTSQKTEFIIRFFFY
jgi:hypothetical protein